MMIAKDSLEYFYALEPIHAKYGFDVSVPEGAKLVSSIGDWAEFGVCSGKSARKMLEMLPSDRKLYLFDSFEGLPEDWEREDDIKRPKGYFKLEKEQIPKFNDERAILKIGWFKDTIPTFAEEHQEPLAFIHIDCDIYSSTICVLDNLNNIIVPGTIIIFDEIHNYLGSQKNEYRALKEFQYKHERQFEYCGRTDKYAAWIKITG